MGRLKKTFTKKLKASSLTEVIVATSILLLVFGIALLTLNNMMTSTLRNNTNSLDTELEKVIYQYRNQQIKIPFYSKDEKHLINGQKITENNINFIEFSAMDIETNKVRSKKIVQISNEE
tara:strand:+ start:36849 stop:37208 length:360 start_codon:yes stop_codon:yes gene_type:complete